MNNYSTVVEKISNEREMFFKNLNKENKRIDFFPVENILHVYGRKEILEIEENLYLITKFRKQAVWINNSDYENIEYIKSFYDEWLMYSDDTSHTMKRTIVKELLSLGTKIELKINQKIMEKIILQNLESLNTDKIDFNKISENIVISILSRKLNIEETKYKKILSNSQKIVSFLHKANIENNDLFEVETEIEEIIKWFYEDKMVEDVMENSNIKHRLPKKAKMIKVCLLINIVIDAFEPFVAILNAYFLESMEYKNSQEISDKKYLSEVIRKNVPFNYLGRTNKYNCKFYGYEINKKTKICLWISASNFDDRVYTNPFEISNSNCNTHLSFGLGNHRCPGAQVVTKTLSLLHKHYYIDLKKFRTSEVNYEKELGISAIKTLKGELI